YKRLEGNKYNVPLEGLQGSTKFKFRARGDNFFTPPKTVSLVPAPTPASVTTDTEEPAYLYHRLPFQRYEVDDPNVPGKKQDVIVDDQMALRGQKHRILGVPRPTSGADNTIEVMLGSKVVIHVEIDNTPLVWGDLSLNKLDPNLRAALKL